jgi:hypothetical protein
MLQLILVLLCWITTAPAVLPPAVAFASEPDNIYPRVAVTSSKFGLNPDAFRVLPAMPLLHYRGVEDTSPDPAAATESAMKALQYDPARYSNVEVMDDSLAQDVRGNSFAGDAANASQSTSITLTFDNGDVPATPGLAFGSETALYIFPTPTPDSAPLVPQDDPQQALGMSPFATSSPTPSATLSSTLSSPSSTSAATSSSLIGDTSSTTGLPSFLLPFATPNATPPTTLTVAPATSEAATTITEVVSQTAEAGSPNTSAGIPPNPQVAAADPVDHTTMRNIFIALGVTAAVVGVLLVFRKQILNRMCPDAAPPAEDEEFWIDRPAVVQHADYSKSPIAN